MICGGLESRSVKGDGASIALRGGELSVRNAQDNLEVIQGGVKIGEIQGFTYSGYVDCVTQLVEKVMVPTEKSIPSFSGELSTNFFESGNQRFIEVVEDNDARVIFLDAFVDESWNSSGETNDCDTSGFGDSSADLMLFLPDPAEPKWVCDRYIEISTLNPVNSSSGGTGILTHSVVGFFKISNTYVGGRWYLELVEVEASMADWEMYAN